MLDAGGDVGTIATGGSQLGSAATTVGSQAKGISSHCSSAADEVGDPALSAAISRLNAALGRTATDLEVDFAQAAAGIQPQITVASSTAAHVASLIQQFATAQKTCHEDVASHEAAAGRSPQTITRYRSCPRSGCDACSW